VSTDTLYRVDIMGVVLGEEMELAKRLVKCEQWKWMAGMYLLTPDCGPEGIVCGACVVYFSPTAEPKHRGPFECWAPDVKSEPLEGAYPDLEDPATVGCLWVMLVDSRADSAHDVDDITIELNGEGYQVWLYSPECGGIHMSAGTKGEAVAGAILFMWGANA